MPSCLSARERLELEKQDGLLLVQPIRNDLHLLGAYTRQVLRLLRGRSASPAMDVLTFMAETFERSVAAQTPAFDNSCARPAEAAAPIAALSPWS